MPPVDDSAALGGLTKRGTHVRAVLSRSAEIESRYAAYLKSQGNPWVIQKVKDFDGLKPSLLSLYGSPPVGFEFISALRQSMTGACPICGRDALGTLDHYLPKEDFCEFAVYSRNLVPACDRCNNKRRNLVKGSVPGERLVHPYFDAFLEQRVISIHAEPPWIAPLLTAISVNVQGDDARVVEWHIQNIIVPSGIIPYVIDLWGKLIAKPSLVLNCTPQTANDVVQQLLRQAALEEHLASSPNSWRSAFYFGISQSPGAAEYLLALLQAPSVGSPISQPAGVP